MLRQYSTPIRPRIRVNRFVPRHQQFLIQSGCKFPVFAHLFVQCRKHIIWCIHKYDKDCVLCHHLVQNLGSLGGVEERLELRRVRFSFWFFHQFHEIVRDLISTYSKLTLSIDVRLLLILPWSFVSVSSSHALVHNSLFFSRAIHIVQRPLLWVV